MPGILTAGGDDIAVLHNALDVSGPEVLYAHTMDSVAVSPGGGDGSGLFCRSARL